MPAFFAIRSCTSSTRATVRENSLAGRGSRPTLSGTTRPAIFRYFKTSPETISTAGMMDVRFPLSLRNVEDLLHERGIDITHEMVGVWWGRFGQNLGRRQDLSRLTHSGRTEGERHQRLGPVRARSLDGTHSGRAQPRESRRQDPRRSASLDPDQRARVDE